VSAVIDLDAIRKRAEAATLGKWWLSGWGTPMICHKLQEPRAYHTRGVGTIVNRAGFGKYSRREDFEFIAHARTDIPDLLTHIRYLEKVIKEML